MQHHRADSEWQHGLESTSLHAHPLDSHNPSCEGWMEKAVEFCIKRQRERERERERERRRSTSCSRVSNVTQHKKSRLNTNSFIRMHYSANSQCQEWGSYM